MELSPSIANEIKRLDRTLSDDPNNPEILRRLGQLYLHEDQWSKAVLYYEKIASKTTIPEVHAELAIGYTGLKNYESAIREFIAFLSKVYTPVEEKPKKVDYQSLPGVSRALKIWADYARSKQDDVFKFYYLGIAALGLGRTREAKRGLVKTVQYNPHFQQALYYLAWVYHSEGNLTKAIELVELGTRNKSIKMHQYHHLLSRWFWEQGQLTRAIKAVEKCLDLQPHYPEGHLFLARLLHENVEPERALEYVDTALLSKPKYLEGFLLKAQILESSFRLDEAEKAYQSCLGLDEGCLEALLALGNLYRNLAKHHQALEYYTKYLGQVEDDPEAYYLMGMTMMDCRRSPEAIGYLKKAVEFSPENGYYLYALGKAYQNDKQLKESLPYFEQAIEVNPRDFRSRSAMGRAYFEEKELTRAQRQFEKAIEINPKDRESHYYLGACHFKLHDFGSAIKAYQQAAQAQPDSALAHFSEGAYLSYQRRYREAIDSFLEAMEIRPEEGDIGLFSTLQLLGTVGIDHAQTGMELQAFAKRRDELFKIFVMALSSFLDARDKYTRYHSRRVAQIGTLLATTGLKRQVEKGILPESVLLEDDVITGITVGGLLHDIGKIGIADDVLNKPGKLTDQEYELIKEHPVIGAEGLKRVPFPWPEVLHIVRSHHEKWNGHGYPDGLKEEETPFEAQIIGVADFYDALTTNRPYRKAFSPSKALSIMQEESGEFFNPILIQAFTDIIDEVIMVPEAPVDETGQYIFGDFDDAYDNLKISWDFKKK